MRKTCLAHERERLLAILASLKNLNYNIKQDIDINSKQTVITDFFLSE